MKHDVLCAGGCGKVQAEVETDSQEKASRHQTILYCHHCSGKIAREKKPAPVSIHDELKAISDSVKSSGLVSPEDLEKALGAVSKALKKMGVP